MKIDKVKKDKEDLIKKKAKDVKTKEKEKKNHDKLIEDMTKLKVEFSAKKNKKKEDEAKLGQPCVFIRYNPDDKQSDKNKLLKEVQKYIELQNIYLNEELDNESDINYYEKLDINNLSGFKVEYLFYWENNNNDNWLVQNNYYDKRDEKIEKVKEYSSKNKEKIKERNAITIICECGVKVRKYGLGKHIKTTNHISIMKEKENLVSIA